MNKVIQNHNLKITATPNYESNAYEPEEGYVWSYDIQVENAGTSAVQIIARNWKIIDSHGNIREISGEGVVGKKPIIKAGEQFKYSSYAQLNNSSGIMFGSYKVKDLETGMIFKVEIPAFSLDSPNEKMVVN